MSGRLQNSCADPPAEDDEGEGDENKDSALGVELAEGGRGLLYVFIEGAVGGEVLCELGLWVCDLFLVNGDGGAGDGADDGGDVEGRRGGGGGSHWGGCRRRRRRRHTRAVVD